VRELDFDVWEDISQHKNEEFLQQYEELGLIGGKGTNTAPAGANVTGATNHYGMKSLMGDGQVTQPNIVPALSGMDLQSMFNQRVGH
jgi:hypothetical protein